MRRLPSGIVSTLELLKGLLVQVVLTDRKKNCHCAPEALQCRKISLFESRASWQCRLGQLMEKCDLSTETAKLSSSHRVVNMVDWDCGVGWAPPWTL